MKFPRAKPRERLKRDLRALSDLREGFKWDLMPLSSQGEALLTEFCFAKLAEISFFCTKFVFSELREGFKYHLKPLPELRGRFKCDLRALPELRGRFKCDLRALSELRERFKRDLRALPKLREHFKCHLMALPSQRDALLTEVLVASQGLHTKLVEIGFLCAKFVISMDERGVLGRQPQAVLEKVGSLEGENPRFGSRGVVSLQYVPSAFKSRHFRAAGHKNAILPYGRGYSRLRFLCTRHYAWENYSRF